MDYEKKYKEALERAKNTIEVNQTIPDIVECVKSLFPELKECEDDKKTKESLMQYIWDMYHKDFYPPRPSIECCDKWLAWLEKQSERDMKEALHTEYEKGRADAIAKMQKEQTQEYLEGVDRVQNYEELTKFEKGFDRIADTYAHRKNKDGYNKPWYTKERAAEMLYWAKEALGIFNEQKSYDNATIVVHHGFIPKSATEAAKEEKVDNQNCVKPANEVEPKFHEGEWITNGRYNKLIVGINSDYPLYIFKDGTSERILDIDKKYHLWTIQDANSGDVLVASDGSVFIYAGLTDKHAKFYVALTKYSTLNLEGGIWEDKNKVHPATKEQRDTLMKVMSDAGYTFDFEKKELKKIEQNTAWSEEDERLSLCLIEDQEEALDKVNNDKFGHSEIISDLEEMYRERIAWLKSIKDRVQPQTKPFKEVYSQDQIDEVDRKIMETKRHYDARLYDAVLKAKDFPMTD